MVDDRQGEGWTDRPRCWPGLRLTSAVRLAFDARKLAIATAGLLLLQLGWTLLDLAFLGSVEVTPDVLPRAATAGTRHSFSWSAETISHLTERLSEPARLLLTPLSTVFDPRGPRLAMLHALLGLAWLIVVWGYCGGAIARIAAVYESHSRQTGIAEAVRFAWRSGSSLILTTCCPLMGLAFCSLAGLLLGLLYRVPGGPAVAGVLLFIPLAAGLVMILLLAAFIAGWPLFHAALASGADDALDALSRTYGYLNQRLILFAAGVAITWAVGMAGLTFVDLLVGGVIRLTQWNLSLLGPGPRIGALFGMGPVDPSTFATRAHRFWLDAVRLVAHAWVFSYFWTAATLLYLWLRQDVDGTPSTLIDPPAAAATSATNPPGSF